MESNTFFMSRNIPQSEMVDSRLGCENMLSYRYESRCS